MGEAHHPDALASARDALPIADKRAVCARPHQARFAKFFWVLPCAFIWAACLNDLRPNVGPLVTEDADRAPVAASDGGQEPRSDGGDLRDASADNDGAQGSEDAAAPVDESACKTKDSDPSTTVSFKRDVWPILSGSAGCRCHDPKSDDPVGVLEAGLTIDSYVTLRMGGDTTKDKIIVPGNPCDSIILQKLSEMPPFGARMPLDGPYLSSEVRTLLSDWIVEGARDN